MELSLLLFSFLRQWNDDMDDETRQKISVVEKRLVDEYGYDAHSAREALNYVTTLLAQE